MVIALTVILMGFEKTEVVNVCAESATFSHALVILKLQCTAGPGAQDTDLHLDHRGESRQDD